MDRHMAFGGRVLCLYVGLTVFVLSFCFSTCSVYSCGIPLASDNSCDTQACAHLPSCCVEPGVESLTQLIDAYVRRHTSTPPHQKVRTSLCNIELEGQGWVLGSPWLIPARFQQGCRSKLDCTLLLGL